MDEDELMQLTVIELTDMIKERGVPVGQNKRKVNLVQRIMVRFLLHLYCPGQLSVEEHTVLQHPGRIDAQIPLARDLYSNKRSMMPMQTNVDVAGQRLSLPHAEVSGRRISRFACYDKCQGLGFTAMGA